MSRRVEARSVVSLQPGGACSVVTLSYTQVGRGVQWTSNDTDHMGESATCKSMVDNDLSSTTSR